ncbi:MAG: hypothetical protein ABMB14_21805 [Myxococcota bacterium]
MWRWMMVWAACAGDPTEVCTCEAGGDDDDDDDTVVTTGTTADTATTPTGDTGDTATDDCPQCDDGLACSIDTCDADGACSYEPAYDCPWPALAVQWLLETEPALEVSLSGAAWDPVNHRLWVVRNSGGAAVWRLVQDAIGRWIVDEDTAHVRAEWLDVSGLSGLDLESLTIPDPVGAPDVVYLMAEGDEQIVAFDLSVPGEAEPVGVWDTSPYLPLLDQLGSEGLTFVPDGALAAAGFVDGDGLPRVSAGGMGGLFFVGHQNGGKVYAFDLGAFDTVAHVGTFDTARLDTSGLEFDAATNRLYLWHGVTNTLEITRLTSSDTGGTYRKLDTEYVFQHPSDMNLEGIAVTGGDDCADGTRSLFLIADDGGPASIQLYSDWPLCP